MAIEPDLTFKVTPKMDLTQIIKGVKETENWVKKVQQNITTHPLTLSMKLNKKDIAKVMTQLKKQESQFDNYQAKLEGTKRKRWVANSKRRKRHAIEAIDNIKRKEKELADYQARVDAASRKRWIANSKRRTHHAVEAGMEKSTKSLKENTSTWHKHMSFLESTGIVLKYAAISTAIYAVAGAFKAGVTASIKYDNALFNNIAVLEVTREQATKLANAALQLGVTYGGSIEDINKVVLTLGRAGVAYKDLAAATKATIELATITGDTFSDTSMVMSTFITNFEGAGVSVKDLANKLAFVANATKMSTTDLGTFANYGLITAKSLGLTINTVGALAAAMSRLGLNASTIGTEMQKLDIIFNTSSTQMNRFFDLAYNGEGQANKESIIKRMMAGDETALLDFSDTLASMPWDQFKDSTDGVNIRVKKMMLAMRNGRDMIHEYSESIKTASDASIQAALKSLGTEAIWERTTNAMSNYGAGFVTWATGATTGRDAVIRLSEELKTLDKDSKGYVETLDKFNIAMASFNSSVSLGQQEATYDQKVSQLKEVKKQIKDLNNQWANDPIRESRILDFKKKRNELTKELMILNQAKLKVIEKTQNKAIAVAKHKADTDKLDVIAGTRELKAADALYQIKVRLLKINAQFAGTKATIGSEAEKHKLIMQGLEDERLKQIEISTDAKTGADTVIKRNLVAADRKKALDAIALRVLTEKIRYEGKILAIQEATERKRVRLEYKTFSTKTKSLLVDAQEATIGKSKLVIYNATQKVYEKRLADAKKLTDEGNKQLITGKLELANTKSRTAYGKYLDSENEKVRELWKNYNILNTLRNGAGYTSVTDTARGAVTIAQDRVSNAKEPSEIAAADIALKNAQRNLQQVMYSEALKNKLSLINLDKQALALEGQNFSKMKQAEVLRHNAFLLELDDQMLKGEISDEYYTKALENENLLHRKTMSDLSMTGVVIQSLTDSLTSGFQDFFNVSSEGFMDFGKLAQSVLDDILNDMLKIIVKQQIIGSMGAGGVGGTGIMGALGGAIFDGSTSAATVVPTPQAFGYAQGGAFNSPSLSAHTNTVVSTPTPFMFAKGGVPGVFGEAGPEAIMPLTKTSKGNLGIQTVGGSQAPQNITVKIINESGEQVKATSSSFEQDISGMIINVVIDAMHTNKGGMRSALGR